MTKRAFTRILPTVATVFVIIASTSPSRAEEPEPDVGPLGIVVESPDALSHPEADHFWRPVHGENRWRMSYNDFFARVGRPDLGDRQDHRDTLKTGLGLGGIGAFAGGLIVLLVGFGNESTLEVGIGGGLAATGAVALLVNRSANDIGTIQ